MKSFGRKAQGTIEYIVIIAIVVVISLVVVGLATGSLDSATYCSS
ncbi:MAG: class III signal peptide-containing protein [archaeon]